MVCAAGEVCVEACAEAACSDVAVESLSALCAAACACRTDESISCAQPLLTIIISKVTTARVFLACSNAVFLKSVHRISPTGLPMLGFVIFGHLHYRPTRLALAARRPTPIGKELLLFDACSFNVQRS